VAVVPLLLVAIWTIKDAVMFGTATSSSWLGMNLTKTTLSAAPLGQLATMRRDRNLSALTAVPAFSPVATYVPRFIKAPSPTGDAALDERTKSDGLPNYNNLVYVKVSAKYLHQDLRYIVARPGQYAVNVARGAELWAEPPDDYPFVLTLRDKIKGYAHAYDAVVLLQFHDDPLVGFTVLAKHRGPSPLQIAWGSVAVFLVAVVGTPAFCWRRRADRALVATLGLMWGTAVYALTVTSLAELGENNRFRFELGPVPLLLAAAVLLPTGQKFWKRAQGIWDQRVAPKGRG
jgi:hypothetical protein